MRSPTHVGVVPRAVYVWLLATACGDAEPENTGPAAPVSQPDATTSAAASSDGGTALPGDTANGGNAAIADLTLTLSAARNAVCAGECTSLHATVSGGTAPYTLSWSHGFGAELVQQVCPTQTTQYSLLVRDSGQSALEFGGAREVQKSVTVEVQSSCPSTVQPGEQQCRIQLPLTGSAAQVDAPSAHGLAVDAQGNSYLAVQFRGTVAIGNKQLHSDSAAPGDLLLAKFDANCRSVWSKQWGPGLRAAAVAADAAGNVVLVGSADTVVNLGEGKQAQPGALLAKWNAEGALQWTHSYAAGISGRSVSLDRDGNVLFAVDGFTTMDLGGGRVRDDVNALCLAAAKLDARGNHVFTYGLDLSVSSAWLGAAQDGSFYLAGQYARGPQLPRQHAVRLDGAGRVLGAYQSGDMPDAMLNSDDNGAVDKSGNVVLTQRFSRGERTLFYRTLQPQLTLHAEGKLQVQGALSDAPHAVAANDERFLVAAQVLTNQQMPRPAALRLVLYSMHGDKLWERALSEGVSERPLGLAFNDAGAVTVASVSASQGSTQPSSIVITRLQLPATN